MSRKLLENLNGRNNGLFRKWIDRFDGEPRVAWYPSAGEDFRDLLYLNPKFSEHLPPTEAEPKHPDIFLHTDYFPWSTSTFLDSNRIHVDDRTWIQLESTEELPRCELPIDREIVDFPEGSHATGRVVFLNIYVNSNVLGSFSVPVIYAFVENGAFCSRKILANEGKISHVVHVRCGGGRRGGGKSSGIWLLNVLQRIACKCFVTDSHYHRQSGDQRTHHLYPELSGNEETKQLKQIRIVRSEGWSGHGDVSWNLVRKA